VVPPGDGAAMAEAVLALRDDPATAAAMAARGRRYVAERYSRAVSAARLEAVVRELAGVEASGGPGADGAALAGGEEAA
jgi:glycosyltransferase involved in cell wall biosynthesis